MDRFIIKETEKGYTVRWAHNNRAVKTITLCAPEGMFPIDNDRSLATKAGCLYNANEFIRKLNIILDRQELDTPEYLRR